MTPAQMRQLAALRPSTVQRNISDWISKAAKALIDAAATIDQLRKVDD